MSRGGAVSRGVRSQAGRRWLVSAMLLSALVVPAAVALPGCARPAAVAGGDTARPATVETVAGSEVKRVRLAADAARRIGIQTAVVVASPDNPARTVIPYSALLYGAGGDTSAYTNPEPLVFVRRPVTVELIEDDRATLSDGPPAGTRVVTVGAAELLGVEEGVGSD